MSDVDFDALRDPDTPVPGTRERDGVQARARQLRTRSRINRLALSSVSVVAVLALVFGIVASQRDNGPQVVVEGPTATAPSSVGDRFVPPTSIEHGFVTVPVTFPDGETLTMRYPETMRIAQLGFAGGVSLGGTSSAAVQASVRYTTIERVYGNAKPVAVYPGPSGEPVRLFHSSQEVHYGGDTVDYLAFQFGPWLVQVSGFNRADRAIWARGLTGSLDPSGYLILHAQAPLTVSNRLESGFGAPVSGVNGLELDTHLYCGQAEAGGDSERHRRFVNGDGTHGVAWCVGDDLHVSATGSESFVDLVDRGLQVSALTAPGTVPTTSTTTTTTPLVTSNFSAFSASFVSPQHGWALTNGPIEETTDGGRTWGRIGSMGGRFHGRIRFADAKHGYAFTDSQLIATDDGGRLWSVVDPPFTNVFDLAVANGVVYLAARGEKAHVIVWSTPVGRERWTEHPTGIPIGAGPVPHTQLVFTGNAGWLLQVDRTVVGGAVRTGSGDWTPWVAPCANVEGSAYLAAASPADLAASCHEHEWGGGEPASALYTSHDGGGEFRRTPAPASGEIAAANASTTIVNSNGVLRRTADGGRSWTVVAREPGAYHAVDLGFTTPTQGFVIFDDGTMLMTYDAGASWQRVTLP